MRRSVFLFCLLVASMAAYGLQVDKEELSKGQNQNIQFVNYVGPHAKIDTIAEIVAIGRELGADIVAAQPGEFSYFGKYRVIHAVSDTEQNKLDADIFIIEKTAEVDDVVNLIRILSGYLETAYSYSPADAAVLAKFVVYYNAAYRGDMHYISSVYKTIVTRNVSAQNVGIARVYSKWPGQTRMLIPLTQEAGKGNLSTVGSEQLTSPKVIQNLRKEPNKGIPERKAMTELQQKGIIQGQQKVESQKAAIAKQEQKVKEQQQAIQQQESQLQQQKQAAMTPAQKEAVASKQQALQQQKAAVAQQQGQVEAQKQAVAKQEQQLAERQKNVQKERQSIASDQRQLLQEKPPGTAKSATQSQPTAAATTAQPGEVLFVYDGEGSGQHLGRLVIIDRVSGKLKAQSALNTIRGRSYLPFAKGYVVVAGRSGGNATVRLVVLDAASLASTAESDVEVAPSSSLAVDGTSVYAIEEKGGKAHLARFDTRLKVQAESPASVNPFSYIVLSGSEIYVQDVAGNILILDKTDLKEKKRSGG